MGEGPVFLFFIPADSNENPVRMVYGARTYSGDRTTPGVVKPIGTPGASCVLTPLKS